MKKIKFNFNTIIKFIALLVIFYLLSKGNINSVYYPFSTGFLFGLMWCNYNVFISSIAYIIGYSLAGFSLVSVIVSVFSVIVLLITYGIHKKLNKKIPFYLLNIYYLISQGAFIFLSITSLKEPILYIVLNLVIGLVFLNAMVLLLKNVLSKNTLKLKYTENICLVLFIIALSSGLYELNIYGFEIIKLATILSILISGYYFKSYYSLIVSVSIGIGAFINCFDLTYVGVYSIFSLTFLAFKSGYKFIPCIAITLIDFVLGFFFKVYGVSFSYLSILPTVIACMIFLCIKEIWLIKIQKAFDINSDSTLYKNIVNRNRESLKRRLIELSDVFFEMDKAFRGLIKGKISDGELVELIKNDICKGVCSECKDYGKCHRTNQKQTQEEFNTMILSGVKRGKLTLMDLPANLTTKCNNINKMINNINNKINAFKNYSNMVVEIDNSKLLLASQLSGVSSLLKNLSTEVNSNINFDAKKEEKLLNELKYNDIDCTDALIYNQTSNIMIVTLIVKTEDINYQKITEIVSKALKHKVTVFNEEYCSLPSYSILSLKTAPKYEIVFGSSNLPKTGNEVSGDCFSLIRIDNDKFMIALCDGMGSGTKASEASNLAINLIENFYKAGFDDDVIVSSINNLLTLGGHEIFSAIDICVIDLQKGWADFVKMGSPNSFIKNKLETTMVSGDALPIGIVEEAKPYTKQVVLKLNDMIILCSDGITDAFRGDENLNNFINNLEAYNPQEVSNQILERAKVLNNGIASDDMTVIVARIFVQ